MLRVVLRNPAFMRLWLAQVVSQTGDWLNRVACLVVIGALGGSDAQLGLGALFGAELVLRLLPSAVLVPLAGPVADRMPRRLLMVAADLSRAAVVLGYLLVDEARDLPLLYALIMLQMGISVFFDAARSAALPDTVQRGELHAAYALSAATWSVTLSIGALIGGWMVSWIGVHGVFIVDAVSYVASACFLFGLKLPPVPRQAEVLRWRDLLLLTDLRRGLAHVRLLRITPILWAKTYWGAAGGYLVVLSLAGHDRFGEAPEGQAIGAAAFATGALYSARGVGTGLGPILARWWMGSTDRALRWQIGLGFSIAAIGYALFGFTERLDLACVCVGIAHLGGSVLWVASTIFWQKHVGDAFRGRVFSIEFLAMSLAFAVGGALGGWIYDTSGSLSLTTWIISGLVLVLGGIWSFSARGVEGPQHEVDVIAAAEEAD